MKEFGIIYDENYLVRRYALVDANLPLRLQKKQLLRELGFPVDSKATVSSTNLALVEKHLNHFMMDRPFLIVTSMRPHQIATTLFSIESSGRIQMREQEKWYDLKENTLVDELISLPKGTWLEFVKPLWSGNVLAGRMVFVSFEKQLLELQRGVRPVEIGLHAGNSDYLFLTLNYFDFCRPADWVDRLETNRKINISGIRRGELEMILGVLGHFTDSFLTLARIGRYPTLEFGYSHPNCLTVVDIDWADQYLFGLGYEVRYHNNEPRTN